MVGRLNETKQNRWMGYRGVSGVGADCKTCERFHLKLNNNFFEPSQMVTMVEKGDRVCRSAYLNISSTFHQQYTNYLDATVNISGQITNGKNS